MRSAVISPSDRGTGWRWAVPPWLVSSLLSPGLGSSVSRAPAGPIIEIHAVAAVRIVGARIAVRCSVSARRQRGFAFEEVGCRLISMFNRVSLHDPFIGSERKHAAPQSEVAGE